MASAVLVVVLLFTVDGLFVVAVLVGVADRLMPFDSFKVEESGRFLLFTTGSVVVVVESLLLLLLLLESKWTGRLLDDLVFALMLLTEDCAAAAPGPGDGEGEDDGDGDGSFFTLLDDNNNNDDVVDDVFRLFLLALAAAAAAAAAAVVASIALAVADKHSAKSLRIALYMIQFCYLKQLLQEGENRRRYTFLKGLLAKASAAAVASVLDALLTGCFQLPLAAAAAARPFVGLLLRSSECTEGDENELDETIFFLALGCCCCCCCCSLTLALASR